MRSIYNYIIKRTGRFLGTDADSLFRGTFWLSLGSFAGMAVAFFLSVLYARYLTKDVYGEYRYVLSMLSTLGIFTFPGLGLSLTRSIARGFDRTYINTSRLIFRLSFIVTFAGLLVSAYYYIFTPQHSIAIALALGSILIPLVEGLGNWRGLLDGLKQYKTKSLWNSGIKLSYGAGMLIAVLLSYFYNASPEITLVALVGTYFGIHGIGNIIASWKMRSRIHADSDVDPESSKYGMHLSLAGILSTIATYFDGIIIYNILGPEQLALYAFAIAPPEQIKAFLSNTALVSFTKLSSATKNVSARVLAQTLPKKAFRACGIALIIVLAYIAAAPYIYTIFFPKYAESVELSQVFSLAIIFLPFVVFHTALDAIGSLRVLYINRAIAPVVQILLLLTLVPVWGLWGAVLARVLGRVANFLIAYIAMQYIGTRAAQS